MIMERRLIFPTIMFILASASFAFGIWQYVYASRVQVNSAKRMAFIVKTIQDSGITQANKRSIYASIFQQLPPAPSLFGIDFSDSFASQDISDGCTSDGQRAICQALVQDDADERAMTAICGFCRP